MSLFEMALAQSRANPSVARLEDEIDELKKKYNQLVDRYNQLVKDYKNIDETYRYDLGQLEEKLRAYQNPK